MAVGAFVVRMPQHLFSNNHCETTVVRPTVDI